MQEVIQTKELATLKTQVTKLEDQVNTLSVTSPDEYKSAIDIVSKLKETGSTIKNKKESITKPLNEALKNARDLFRPIEDQFKQAEMIIKGKMLDYKRKVDEEARKKEEQIAKRVEKGTLKLETAERKIDEVQRIDQTTKSDIGEVQVRKVKKVRITDETKIPREYLVPDMVKIRREALGGKEITGVEVYEDETMAVR